MHFIFKKLPLHINPIYGLGALWILAYIPIFVRNAILAEKLKKEGKQLVMANSRGLTALMIDDTPLGMKIANAMGCHENNYEALVSFAVATFSCIVSNVDYDVQSGATALFLLIRLIYTYVYLSKYNGPLRTHLFNAGALVTAALLVIAGYKYGQHNF
eukprot:gene17413-19843_t